MQPTYKTLAKYYDLIYSFKDYETESRGILDLIKKHKTTAGKRLLEAGCGTGKHLTYLKAHFQCDAFDLNKEMVDVAKNSVSGVNFFVDDMVSFDLKEKYDVITCLFSSFGYVKTIQNAEKTIQNFVNHLKKGGVVIIESWFAPEEYTDGRIGLLTYKDDDIHIARTTYSQKKENLSVIEMQYLVAEKGKGIKHFKDVHEIGLFDHEAIKKIMQKHGLKVEILEGIIGRKLFIGLKQ